MRYIKSLLPTLISVAILINVLGCAKALEPGDIMSVDQIAIDGYDSVSYFKDAKATKGNEAITYTYEDIKWYFASQTNKDAFLDDPSKYVPVFGGFGTYALTEEEQVLSNPEIWYIHDEKLYLFTSQKAKNLWFTNLNEMTAKAQVQWDIIIEPTEEEKQKALNDAFMNGMSL